MKVFLGACLPPVMCGAGAFHSTSSLFFQPCYDFAMIFMQNPSSFLHPPLHLHETHPAGLCAAATFSLRPSLKFAKSSGCSDCLCLVSCARLHTVFTVALSASTHWEESFPGLRPSAASTANSAALALHTSVLRAFCHHHPVDEATETQGG